MTDLDDVPPQPLPDADSAGYWEATSRGELGVCRCQGCRLWLHPPLERCSACGARTSFEVVSGEGTVFSFIVANRASVPGFAADVPFAIAIVELVEQPGLRVISRLIDVDAHDVRIGQRVAATIVDLPGGDHRIPVFRVVDNDV